MTLGVTLVLYGAAFLISGDPLTGVYADREQRRLAAAFDERLDGKTPRPTRASRVRDGEALARLRIPRLGLDTIVVEGTSTEDLRKGPGHYRMTSLPGSGRTTAIAGHRTTFGAPFRHIDALRPGDSITVELAHGTFTYRVVGYRIVKSNDWRIIRDRGFDQLVLSACHPIYRASHRYVVFARKTLTARSAAAAAAA